MRRWMVVMAMLVAAALSAVPASAQSGGSPYLGEIIVVAFNFPPIGWAECNGQIMSISQNSALFQLIGTTYGGDGVQTFALPDLRGRTPLHQGQGPGLSPYVIGQTGGVEQVTLNVNQMPQHSHQVFGSTNPGTLGSPSGSVWATQTRAAVYSSSENTDMAPGTLGMTGGGQPHDNLSPYLTMNYIIALEGIFPTQN